jgi:hypothetical protein
MESLSESWHGKFTVAATASMRACPIVASKLFTLAACALMSWATRKGSPTRVGLEEKLADPIHIAALVCFGLACVCQLIAIVRAPKNDIAPTEPQLREVTRDDHLNLQGADERVRPPPPPAPTPTPPPAGDWEYDATASMRACRIVALKLFLLAPALVWWSTLEGSQTPLHQRSFASVVCLGLIYAPSLFLIVSSLKKDIAPIVLQLRAVTRDHHLNLQGAGRRVRPPPPPAPAPPPPPAGDWEYDAGSGLYWSDQQHVYLDVVTSKYYDPQSREWHDPVGGVVVSEWR